MARDDTARERRTEESLLERRDYLKATGAAVAAAAGLGAAASASAQTDYETIEVPAGQTRQFTLGSGDTLENTLIDITAQGATYSINASGDGWTIRNVGIKGQYPAQSGSVEPIVIRTDGGEGLIENFYLGDGSGGTHATGGGTTGIYVSSSHSGNITMRNINVQDWADNGVYGSGAGNGSAHPTPGGGGTVQIEDSFAKGCGSANFRIGTTGSYCKNCVAVGGDRGYWGYYEKTQYVNCDASKAGEQFCSGEDYWEKGMNAVMVLENCRAEGLLSYGPGDIQGTPGDNPRTSPPTGVPLDAQEAAAGTTTSGGSSGSPDGSEDTTSSSDLPNTLSIAGGSGSNRVSYHFSVTDTIQKSTARDATINSLDSITDGSVVGFVAGEVDSYEFAGEISDFSIDGTATVYLNGSQVDASSLGSGSSTTDGSSDGSDSTLPNCVVVDGSKSPNRSTTYSFDVSGEVEKDAENASINAYDDITDGTVTGRVIGGKDAYRFTGEITRFKVDGAAHVSVRDNDDGSA